MIIESVDSG